MIQVGTLGDIYLDGECTGYTVIQAQNGTQVYRREVYSPRGEVIKPFFELPLHMKRYQLAGGKPRKGVGSLQDFERDFKAAIGSL